jgi:hypothetical protein
MVRETDRQGGARALHRLQAVLRIPLVAPEAIVGQVAVVVVGHRLRLGGHHPVARFGADDVGAIGSRPVQHASDLERPARRTAGVGRKEAGRTGSGRYMLNLGVGASVWGEKINL